MHHLTQLGQLRRKAATPSLRKCHPGKDSWRKRRDPCRCLEGVHRYAKLGSSCVLEDRGALRTGGVESVHTGDEVTRVKDPWEADECFLALPFQGNSECWQVVVGGGI